MNARIGQLGLLLLALLCGCVGGPISDFPFKGRGDDDDDGAEAPVTEDGADPGDDSAGSADAGTPPTGDGDGEADDDGGDGDGDGDGDGESPDAGTPDDGGSDGGGDDAGGLGDAGMPDAGV